MKWQLATCAAILAALPSCAMIREANQPSPERIDRARLGPKPTPAEVERGIRIALASTLGATITRPGDAPAVGRGVYSGSLSTGWRYAWMATLEVNATSRSATTLRTHRYTGWHPWFFFFLDGELVAWLSADAMDQGSAASYRVHEFAGGGIPEAEVEFEPEPAEESIAQR